MLPDIALIGRARSGKDEIAKHLVSRHGYARVAFADALKEMALSTDPWIISENGGALRLSMVVSKYGWEKAKDSSPDVRRTLQNLGVAVRNQDPNFWLRQGINKAHRAHSNGSPVVVTDVRFLNEVRALEDLHFMTASVTRPCRITEGLDATDTHVSETELANYPTDRAICNAGSIDDLHADIEKLLLSA